MNFATSVMSKLRESAIGGVARNQAVPALEEVGKATTKLAQHKLAPLVAGTMASLPQVGQEVGATLGEAGKAAFDFGKRNLGV